MFAAKIGTGDEEDVQLRSSEGHRGDLLRWNRHPHQQFPAPRVNFDDARTSEYGHPQVSISVDGYSVREALQVVRFEVEDVAQVGWNE